MAGFHIDTFTHIALGLTKEEDLLKEGANPSLDEEGKWTMKEQFIHQPGRHLKCECVKLLKRPVHRVGWEDPELKGKLLGVSENASTKG